MLAAPDSVLKTASGKTPAPARLYRFITRCRAVNWGLAWRPGMAMLSAWASQYPIIPWVCAPSTSKGYGWDSARSPALSTASTPT